MTESKTIGRVAYEAYAARVFWKSFSGEPLPEWKDVRPDIQAGWQTSATAVLLADSRESTTTEEMIIREEAAANRFWDAAAKELVLEHWQRRVFDIGWRFALAYARESSAGESNERHPSFYQTYDTPLRIDAGDGL